MALSITLCKDCSGLGQSEFWSDWMESRAESAVMHHPLMKIRKRHIGCLITLYSPHGAGGLFNSQSYLEASLNNREVVRRREETRRKSPRHYTWGNLLSEEWCSRVVRLKKLKQFCNYNLTFIFHEPGRVMGRGIDGYAGTKVQIA